MLLVFDKGSMTVSILLLPWSFRSRIKELFVLDTRLFLGNDVCRGGWELGEIREEVETEGVAEEEFLCDDGVMFLTTLLTRWCLFSGFGDIFVCTTGTVAEAEVFEAVDVIPVRAEAADINVDAVAVDNDSAFCLLLFGSLLLLLASFSLCSCSSSSFFMCFTERFLSLGMTSAAPACNFVECLSKRSLRLNFLEQILHVKGFSFVCERSCLFKCS